MRIISHFRQPAYTGKNRCTPCTVTNVVIAALGSATIAIVSTALGALLFMLSLGIIYIRGYLIPGTPTFTKRYFPDRVLSWFDKGLDGNSIDQNDESIRTNPEQILLDAHVITLCENESNFCLSSDFRVRWRERQYAIQNEDPDDEDILAALGASLSETSVEKYSNALAVSTNGRMIGQWPSQAAITADITAAAELAEYYSDWSRLSSTERAHVLASLRIFIERCPECDGLVYVEQEVIDSCCMSHDVVVSTCQSCNAQLFEVEWDDEFAAP